MHLGVMSMAGEKPTNEKLAKLLEQKRVIDAQIKKERNRENDGLKKMDTRRKILAGAWVLDEAEQRPDFKKFVYVKLGSFLIRMDNQEPLSIAPSPAKKTRLL